MVIQRFWVDGLDKRLPVLVTFLAVILLTHSMAMLTWKLVPAPKISDQISGSQTTRTGQSSMPKGNQPQASKIARWNLFGKYEVPRVEPVKPVQQVETAPDTKLNLKLRGVFASPNPKFSRAIIADAKSNEDSYSIDAPLPGGAILRQIFSDKVILEHNGKLETLRLPADGANLASSGPSLSHSSSRGSTSRVSSSSRPKQLASSSSSSQPSVNTSNSALLKKYRDDLLNDPQSVMGLVRAEPYKKNGQLAGYRIRPGKDRQLLRKFGLRSGDVVTAINGVPMNNPIKALEVMRDLSSATQLNVEVERRGVPQSFSFSIDQ